MRHLILILLMAFASIAPADAEPVSVRCDARYLTEPQPYFMTFDIEKRRFVFERAGGNIVAGDIVSANDEQLDLSLRGEGGRILLTFDRKRNMMTWPGLGAGDLGRSLLQHGCTATPERTVLSFFYQPGFDAKRRDPVDAFSLSCPAKTVDSYFITMDRATKTVLIETEAFSGTIAGDITDITDGIIKFTFGRGPPDVHEALWDERRKALTLIARDPSRPNEVQACKEARPRSILEGLNWERLKN